LIEVGGCMAKIAICLVFGRVLCPSLLCIVSNTCCSLDTDVFMFLCASMKLSRFINTDYAATRQTVIYQV